MNLKEKAKQLFEEKQRSKFSESPILPYQENVWHIHDTALILTYHSNNDIIRDNACKFALSNLKNLNPKPYIVIVEAVLDNKKQVFNHEDADMYLRIDGTEEDNGHLFFKEALFNYAVKHLNEDIKYLILHDIDAYPLKPDWAFWIRNRLEKEPGISIQCYKTYTDTHNPKRNKVRGYVYAKHWGVKSIGAAPGLSWAVTRGYWNRVGGMNPYMFMGGGDAVWVHETDSDSRFSETAKKWSFYRTSLREVPKNITVYAPYELIHANHDVGTRAYYNRNITVDSFIDRVDEVVELDKNGLLKWKNPKHPLKTALSMKNRMIDDKQTQYIILKSVIPTIPERKDICIEPWTVLKIEAKGATFCCWAETVTPYKLFEGPYTGKDIWNSDEIVEFRKKMLIKGHKMCPDTKYCHMTWSTRTVEEQIEFYKGLFGDSDNWEKIRNEIYSGKTHISTPPLSIRTFIGSQCQCNCRFCWTTATGITEDKKKPALEDIKKLKPLYKDAIHCHFIGGDLFALTDREIDEWLKLPKDGAKVWTTTNGHGLTLKRYEKYVENGVLNDIGLSLDTVDPDHYFEHRGRPLENLLKNLGEIYNKYPKHCIRQASTVVTGWNYKDGPELVKAAHKYGIKEVYFTPYQGRSLHINGFGHMDIFTDGYKPEIEEEFKDVLKEVNKLGKELGVKIYSTSTIIDRFKR